MEPFVLNGRTMIPIRFMSEALGARVNWDSGSQKITIRKSSDKQLEIYPYVTMKNTMYVSQLDFTKPLKGAIPGTSSYAVYLDAAPVVKNNRTFLPARIIAEELGFNVNWDAKNNTVVIGTKYLGGPTYKEHLKALRPDPYQWSPYIKAQFEREMLDSGLIESLGEIKYRKANVYNGEGYYSVSNKYSSFMVINAKT